MNLLSDKLISHKSILGLLQNRMAKYILKLVLSRFDLFFMAGPKVSARLHVLAMPINAQLSTSCPMEHAKTG